MSRFARAVLVIVVGLGVAFGVFYFAGWPSTLEGSPAGGDEVGFNNVGPRELLHFGVTAEVIGNRPVRITSVRLIDPSPGLELVSIRVGPGGVGALRGPQPDIERLPMAAGSTFRSGKHYVLIVTMRAASLGTYRLRGVLVRYSSGWISRSAGLGPQASLRVVEGPTPVATR